MVTDLSIAITLIRRSNSTGGLHQRLNDHLRGRSTFVGHFYKRYGAVPKLRKGYTFQCLVVKYGRQRLLLEYLATVRLSPKHLLTGEKRKD